MTATDILEMCRWVKESGRSSKVPVPISALEKLCRDALAYQSMPKFIKDAAQEAK